MYYTNTVCRVFTHTADVVSRTPHSYVLHDLKRIRSHCSVQPKELQPPVADPQVLNAAFEISTERRGLLRLQHTSHIHRVTCLDTDRPHLHTPLFLSPHIQHDKTIRRHLYAHKVGFPIVNRIR